ncbi:MBL fold metallo-hydrolase [Paeniglutamicibacter sp. ABSL32-1]|uniref:MBL fold metallo-hydrolase n=1 Tax=Paeniglutamicibacter quisquiliarum TaxID=2849498 RepID=UPI001C2DBB66|nr:MBL fold metallo-hydrolase [Paeniglutamicibacter quisquiliarum]MBV1780501.1 MBL fold metallo-hydrolase [Paeniglutamicibacter quisquiliarum]
MTKQQATRASEAAEFYLAPNPGPMSLEGTNSWVLRAPGSEHCVIVDPGPDDAGHLAALAAESVELILITHRHHDHTEGIDTLHRLTGAPVRAVLPEHCRGGEVLRDGEEIHAAGLRLRVLGTPGHTSDSLCFLLPDDGANGSMLTGDTILGRGTTILDAPDGTLADYLSSLDKLEAGPDAMVLPAHGPVLPSLHAVVREYRAHRHERLAQIRAALAQIRAVAAGGPTVAQVTDAVYADVDPLVRRAAEISVAAQLHYLEESGAS